MDKKGQVSLFMVVGVLMVVVFGVLVVLFSSADIGDEPVFDIQPVNNYVQKCLDTVGRRAVLFTSMQGGYYDAPSESEPYSVISIPYYWIDGEDRMPSKQTIEQEISKYVEDNLEDCIGGFESLEEQGYSFQDAVPEIETTITMQDVAVDMEYPVKASIRENTAQLERFSSSVDINLDEKYSIVRQIMQKQKEDPDSMPLGQIADLAYKNDFEFETINLKKDVVAYTLIFEEDTGENLVYAFLARYGWSEQGEEE